MKPDIPGIFFSGGFKMGSYLTRGGIALNIKESPYKVSIENYEFMFSSRLYMDSFIKKLPEFEQRLGYYILIKTRGYCDVHISAAIILYESIEKRGFYIINKTTGKSYESIHDFRMKLEVS